MAEFNVLTGLTGASDNLDQFTSIIETVMALPEDQLNSTVIESVQGMVSGAITPAVREQSIQQIIESYKNLNTSRGEMRNEIAKFKASVVDVLNELQPSPMKRSLLESVFSIIYGLFDDACARYLSYDIELPIKLDEGAQIPTYAHDTDAAADLYAAEDMMLPAHSLSNMIQTGVHIALPEGWVGYVVPRSSIGLKTPLRLSNSVGVIDSKINYYA